MFDRERTKEILVVIFAALFVTAFAYSAFAAEEMLPTYAGNYSGTVTAVQNSRKIITVQSASGDERMFTMIDHGLIMKCGKAEARGNIKVGDDVTIYYFENTAGNYVADSVALSPGEMEQCS